MTDRQNQYGTWLPPGPGPTPSGPSAGPGAEWSEMIRGRLFGQRIVLIRGLLDDATANQAAAELMTLDATGDERVTIHLDASGDTVEAAFAVMDVIDLLGVPVHVRCLGRAEGPAIGVLAVAAHRAATPHARFRLADPHVAAQGSASDLARFAAHHLAQLSRFHQRVATATRRPAAEVAADSAAGRYLDAEGALRYGLLDELVGPRGSVRALPGRNVGFRP